MLSFKINVDYWTALPEDERNTRLDNLRFVNNHLEKMVPFLQQNGINITYEIFDFSPEPQTDVKVTHIPFGNLGEFRSSEKYNIMIDRTSEDVFIGWDADVVIDDEDWDSFLQVFKNFTIDGYYNSFSLYCISDSERSNIDYITYSTTGLKNLSGHYYVGKENTMSMGGLFICPTQYLKMIDGFNPKFKYRGEHDGEIHDRLQKKLPVSDIRSAVRSFHPIHLPHIYTLANPLYGTLNEL